MISSTLVVAALMLKGWERLSVEADTSTLTITTGMSIYINNFFPLTRSVKICSLETLAKLVPQKRFIVSPRNTRSSAEKTKWQIVAQLSGIGIERMCISRHIINRNNFNNSRDEDNSRGFMEMEIDFGVPVEDYDTCRR